ncbi:hypothetical protein DICPUDRAFT_75527 [Dictyostelium purpureum]|uniref:Uncharacterized protein n=1 Tax=Dictyostelium purpureum TaxID=5786 RepID=F0ZAX1_DICPU|nr:uncharacterized protein DICPUDRAFT_75527 [Dictyostelium purpureum]EGC38903.1 hypothetical protein DICPUDRAFT_75527 [Dictyostelium purpureum]|eukprot:XP_003284583.1 hypothetical protein DICPUDRAFT_75527 [Dictyostelium purpureum]
MKVLLLLVVLLAVIQYSVASFVYVQRFDGGCGETAVDGQYIEENYCDYNQMFGCSADGTTIFVTEYDNRGDCHGRMVHSWNFTAGACATDRNNNSITASCVSTYDLPSNSLVRFDYVGQCNSTNWKNEITNVFFNEMGVCTNSRDPNNQVSFNVLCSSTANTMTQQVFKGDGCTGTPIKENTFPIENKCGWWSNSITVCNA